MYKKIREMPTTFGRKAPKISYHKTTKPIPSFYNKYIEPKIAPFIEKIKPYAQKIDKGLEIAENFYEKANTASHGKLANIAHQVASKTPLAPYLEPVKDLYSALRSGLKMLT